MSTGYQIYDPYGTYFVTCTVVDWVDLFSRKRYRDILVESLRFCCAKKGLFIHGFVIMTNHLHLIARAEGAGLSAVLRDFKKFTAVEMLKAIQQEPESRREWLLHRFGWNGMLRSANEKYQVWTHDNHAVEIHSEAFMRQKLHYTHDNPVRAGWVEKAEDWLYSSARAYMSMECCLPVTLAL